MSLEFDAIIAAVLDVEDRGSLANAVQRAQQWMENDRLIRPQEQQGPIGSFLLSEDPAETQLASWRRRLSIQMAGYSGCRMLRGQNPTNSLWIVGREVSIRMVKRLFLSVTVKIDELAKKIQPELDPVSSKPLRSQLKTWNNDLRLSLIHEMDAAMQAGMDEAQRLLNVYPDTSLKWEQRATLRWMKQYLQLMPLRKSIART
jgi:hypothetical protein